MPSTKVNMAKPKPFPKKLPAADAGTTPAQLIEARIQELDDWRGQLLAHLRELIRSSDPEITEEWKWNVPVWSCNGIICTGETYKRAVKLTFAKGATLPDPDKLFNSSLEGAVRRAIDFPEGCAVNDSAVQALVKAAASLNRMPKPGKASG
jgi:hypothetical protein